MANPKSQEKYTQIPNELLEHMAKVPMSGQEWQVIVTVFRYTYGFHKKENLITLTQIAEYTGLRRQRVYEAIKRLKDRNIVTGKRYKNRQKLGINTVYETWKAQRKNVTVTEKRYTCNGKPLQSVTEKRSRASSKPATDKGSQNRKEKIKKILKKEESTHTKKRFLDFVFLSNDEHRKLLALVGNDITLEYISRLNDYLGQKGKRYKSHYYTIRNWLRRDGKLNGDNPKPEEDHQTMEDLYPK